MFNLICRFRYRCARICHDLWHDTASQLNNQRNSNYVYMHMFVNVFVFVILCLYLNGTVNMQTNVNQQRYEQGPWKTLWYMWADQIDWHHLTKKVYFYSDKGWMLYLCQIKLRIAVKNKQKYMYVLKFNICFSK